MRSRRWLGLFLADTNSRKGRRSVVDSLNPGPLSRLRSENRSCRHSPSMSCRVSTSMKRERIREPEEGEA